MAAQMVCKQDELQIIVLGYNRSGKTATINTFLGVGAYHQGEGATHSVKREGVVVGRKVTLIDTPGWWRFYSATQTTEYIKRELVLSTSLCPPGPHAFLLVVKLDNQFTENEQTSVVEHCELLGANIWEHTIVLFTKGDLLTDKTIEERIKSKDETLEWLVRTCGGRFHVFNNKTKRDDQSQVKTLLDKLDELIASNHHRPFEVDHIKLKDIEKAKKADKERGLKFKEKVTEQRKRIKTGEVLPLPEIRMLLVGWMISGKSYAGNIILNGDHFTPGKVTEKAESRQGEVCGRNLTVVDTPGWWKFLPTKYTPGKVKLELERGVGLCKHPHAIVLTLPVDVSFHEEQRHIIQETLETHLGEDVWRHTIILFTFGNLLKDTTIEEVIESEGKALQWLVQRCGNRYHFFGERAKSSSEVGELLGKIEQMVAGNCVHCPIMARQTDMETKAERHKADNDVACTDDVIDALYREWLRRDEKMIKEVWKKWEAAMAACKQKTDKSMDNPLEFQGESQSMDTISHSETFQDKPSYTAKDELQNDKNDQSIQRQRADDETLASNLKDLLDYEWRRRDFILKELVREAVKELKRDGSSEPDPKEQRESRDKVVDWLLKSSGYGSYMSDSQDLLNVSDKDSHGSNMSNISK
ncbi:GTPase IMAP family member 8-like isoform X2 [Alosa sapidissima]|uniref:GTPase IMAP family member 8-like isoform X2 n=1 Tax=Alosa sapidissima TaxID=34773 RepID=UPI001C08FFB4|nr:GTPase IMAP family member 8-like isoform X2 [Alosa sapidissima]